VPFVREVDLSSLHSVDLATLLVVTIVQAIFGFVLSASHLDQLFGKLSSGGRAGGHQTNLLLEPISLISVHVSKCPFLIVMGIV